jgi:Ran GTPase-activating protein (RanGAP) involved in mRNA processing and transport
MRTCYNTYTHTQVLTLSSLDLSGPDVFALAQCLKHNRKLVAISLENCRLHGDGLAAVFLALAMNTKIKTLNLSSNVIGVPAPSVKPKVSSLTAMSTVRMNQEEHEDLPLSKSVQALADFIRCNTSLENLQLRSCGLTDIAIRAMSTSLCLNFILPLAICDLSDNALGDDSVVALVICLVIGVYMS